MSKLDYWRESLGNAIPDRIFTDTEIEYIISIAEMESEYSSNHDFYVESPPIEKEEPIIKYHSTCCNGAVCPSKGAYMGEVLFVCDRCRKYLSSNQIKKSHE